ncbi:MAG: hypothetical protein ACK51K_09160 [Gammaproteobacteria bacterium]
MQTPERAPVLIGQGGGGIERIERGHPVGIEGVADRAAAPLALDGGDDMGSLPVSMTGGATDMAWAKPYWHRGHD